MLQCIFFLHYTQHNDQDLLRSVAIYVTDGCSLHICLLLEKQCLYLTSESQQNCMCFNKND